MGQDHSPAAALPALPAHPGAFFTRALEKHFCGCLFTYFTRESKKGSIPFGVPLLMFFYLEEMT